jgi:hypothetical protein
MLPLQRRPNIAGALCTKAFPKTMLGLSGKMKKPLERTKTGGRVKNCRKKIAD